ncbi:MAG: hypothetical protein LBL46_03180 [Rickettsiales bacterium]|jgi:hypothetical protein|nr:hypothetical protein [Rickettsiales bacterium]
MKKWNKRAMLGAVLLAIRALAGPTAEALTEAPDGAARVLATEAENIMLLAYSGYSDDAEGKEYNFVIYRDECGLHYAINGRAVSEYEYKTAKYNAENFGVLDTNGVLGGQIREAAMKRQELRHYRIIREAWAANEAFDSCRITKIRNANGYEGLAFGDGVYMVEYEEMSGERKSGLVAIERDSLVLPHEAERLVGKAQFSDASRVIAPHNPGCAFGGRDDIRYARFRGIGR